jgi:hypothetical protein
MRTIVERLFIPKSAMPPNKFPMSGIFMRHRFRARSQA